MRFVVNGLIALMLLGILAGVMVHHNAERLQREQMQEVRSEVRRFQRQVMLQTTLRHTEINDRGYPETIDPHWFEDTQPQNQLLSASHPWVEVAHFDERQLEHPPVKIAAHSGVSRFWYNPYNGRVRARVPPSTSDAKALEMYNFINDANLPTLFADDQLQALINR